MTTLPSDYVYLDNAATTPLSENVANAMAEALKAEDQGLYGNANSLHSIGRAAFSALEDARTRVMRALGAHRPDEIIFTSGATESDNAALRGIVSACMQKRRQAGHPYTEPRIVVSEIEHEAILEECEEMKAEGIAVTILPVNKAGFVEIETFEKIITNPEYEGQIILASVMMANNEIASIQPIKELARIAHEHGVYFHTDATQALGKTPFNAEDLGIDAASFSAHKICGPKGLGVLYLRQGCPFDAFLVGGGQERGLRSGTQNVPSIIGAAVAFEDVIHNYDEEVKRQRSLRDLLYKELLALKGVEATVDVAPESEEYLPNIVHVCVRGQESESMILQFDMLGFAVSGGSACSSQSMVASHVLRAINTQPALARGALRISLSHCTTEEDVYRFIDAAKKVLA